MKEASCSAQIKSNRYFFSGQVRPLVVRAEGRKRAEYQISLGKKGDPELEEGSTEDPGPLASRELGLLCLVSCSLRRPQPALASFNACSQFGQSLTGLQGRHSCALDSRDGRSLPWQPGG